MVTFDDCVGLSDLTPEEISAIAEHEHVPDMLALEMGSYLVHTREGSKRIKAMIADDIRIAKASGHAQHASELRQVLRHYIEQHLESGSKRSPHH
jgi:hypothetical protein